MCTVHRESCCCAPLDLALQGSGLKLYTQFKTRSTGTLSILLYCIQISNHIHRWIIPIRRLTFNCFKQRTAWLHVSRLICQSNGTQWKSSRFTHLCSQPATALFADSFCQVTQDSAGILELSGYLMWDGECADGVGAVLLWPSTSL